MQTFLYFNVPAAGHVNPSLGIIAALTAGGARVVCCNGEEYRAKLEAVGAEFVPYPPSPAIQRLALLQHEGNIPQNATLLLEIAAELLPFCLEQIERVKPDAVIFDSLAGWGRWAAQKAEIPAAAFITTLVLTPTSLPPMPLKVMAKNLWLFARHTPDYLAARRKLAQVGVRGAGYVEALTNLSPSCNVVFTSQAFQPGGDRFGAAYHFIGASVGARADRLDFTPDPAKPLVYVSLGTLNNRDVAFYRACFEALGDLPVQVVMSIGRDTDPTALGAVPENTLVRPFVAQLEVLKHARMFITHGGMNSVHEGLLSGVPLVVVPQQLEQAAVAKRVEQLGAGIALLHKPTTSAMLRSAVERVLSDGAYAARAGELGQGLREAGGAEKAAHALVTWAAKGVKV